MSMKMMNAAYLVDNAALLSLQEKQDGVEFHCFDMDSKVQTTEGHIGWDVLDKQPSSTLEESARVVALQKISQLDGLAVAPVAPEMLEQVRGGRKVLWQMKRLILSWRMQKYPVYHQQLRGSVQNSGWQCSGDRVSEPEVLSSLRIYGRISFAPGV